MSTHHAKRFTTRHKSKWIWVIRIILVFVVRRLLLWPQSILFSSDSRFHFVEVRTCSCILYYLAPSIVGVVIVVVLSLMCSTEARCFFMVTVPFYYLTNLCASADCVFLWTSFLFELYIRLVLHVHFVTTEASKVSCLGFIIRHGLLLFLHRYYH